MEAHQGERERFSPPSQNHLPLSSGVIHLDMILIDEGLSVHDPHDQDCQEEAQETAMKVSNGSMHENGSALLPLPQETWLRQKPLLCQQRGIHEGDLSHHHIFMDEIGKGRMQGWRSGQLLKSN